MKKIFIGIIFLAGLFFLANNAYNSTIYNSAGDKDENIDFEVKPGESVTKIINDLKDKGLVKSTAILKFYIWQTKNETKFQAGQYKFSEKMSLSDIIGKLTRGDVISKEKNIKILEGWDISDMDDYFFKNDILKKEEFGKRANQKISDWSFDFLKPDFLQDVPRGATLEGYIFPDTYRIFEKATVDNIIKKTLTNFGHKLNSDLRSEIKKQGKSIHDIITLASIIEKEVNQKKDMAIVSGILYKRMKIGMHLEVDSSVNYISGKSSPSASYTDLQIDSPYNTYKYGGLPPGPICSPSLQAIKAAIHPVKSDYLFYLNRQDTGETIFSKTFDEHLRNKNKYLR